MTLGTPAGGALAFAVLSLAVYRLAALAALEDGPWRLAARWRALVIRGRGGRMTTATMLGDDGIAVGVTRIVGADDDWIVDGIQCPWCVSFWLALPAALAWGWLAGAPAVLVLAAWPAMSAVTCIVHRA